MVKVVMNKFCLDEKYKYPGITRVFLYFAKNSLLNPKLKGKILIYFRAYTQRSATSNFTVDSNIQ